MEYLNYTVNTIENGFIVHEATTGLAHYVSDADKIGSAILKVAEASEILKKAALTATQAAPVPAK